MYIQQYVIKKVLLPLFMLNGDPSQITNRWFLSSILYIELYCILHGDILDFNISDKA